MTDNEVRPAYYEGGVWFTFGDYPTGAVALSNYKDLIDRARRAARELDETFPLPSLESALLRDLAEAIEDLSSELEGVNREWKETLDLLEEVVEKHVRKKKK